MKINDIYLEEFRSLRTRLFDLKLKMKLQAKILNDIELAELTQEINEVKKAMGELVYLSNEKSEIGGKIK